MSVDRLQDRIRKLKTPVVLDLDMLPEHIPPVFLGGSATFPGGWERYCKALLDALAGTVPAVRFSLNRAVLYGFEGVSALKELMRCAAKLDYYVLLDGISLLTPEDAQQAADHLFGEDWKFDGLVTTAYIGSDAIRPYAQRLEQTDRSLFVVLKTANRSGQEVQDLLTGSRLVYQAVADIVSRFSQGNTGRSGYTPVAAVAPANAPDALRVLREKYKYQFLLVDGYDAPNANAKNCGNAFDTLGHGAAVCAGASITAAWRESPWTQEEYLQAAAEALQRMKKNIGRYVTVL